MATLRDITPEIMEKYKQHRKTADMTRNGKPGGKVRKPALQRGAKSYTVNFELGTIRTVLNLAIKQKYLEHNPVSEVKFLKPDDSKPRRFLTEAEAQRFWREQAFFNICCDDDDCIIDIQLVDDKVVVDMVEHGYIVTIHRIESMAGMKGITNPMKFWDSEGVLRHSNKEIEFEKWGKYLEDIQKKLMFADKTLFNG